MKEGLVKDIYEVEIKKPDDACKFEWDSTEFHYFTASSIKEAVDKAEGKFKDSVVSVKKSGYFFHFD